MNKKDYIKYYIQGSDHYLIPKDVFIELFNEMVNWREESKELNKKYLNAVADYETTMSELQEIKKQQEEFINYMMNTIENITHDETDDEEIKGYLIQRGNTFKEILSKYKEIIGGKE